MSCFSGDEEELRSNSYGNRFLVEENSMKNVDENPEMRSRNGLSVSGSQSDDPWAKKKKKQKVQLEGWYVETSDEDELGRTKSLTNEDLDELKGCLDLGFGFSYDEIPELCTTLPALELCYSMTQRLYLDEQHKGPESMSDDIASSSSSSSSGPIANWKISSPGDDPEDVKARLKYWAQAVACTVRLCN